MVILIFAILYFFGFVYYSSKYNVYLSEIKRCVSISRTKVFNEEQIKTKINFYQSLININKKSSFIFQICILIFHFLTLFFFTLNWSDFLWAGFIFLIFFISQKIIYWLKGNTLVDTTPNIFGGYKW